MDSSTIAPDQTSEPAGDTDDVSDPSKGFRICIDCLPDGTFEVESEPLDESSDDEAQDAKEGPASPPIKDFGAALKQALSLYQNQGDDGEGAFQDGLKSPSDPSMMSAR